MAMYHIKNPLFQDMVVNVPDGAGGRKGLYFPKRGTKIMTEEQYQSTDTQAKLREKYLRLTKVS